MLLADIHSQEFLSLRREKSTHMLDANSTRAIAWRAAGGAWLVR